MAALWVQAPGDVLTDQAFAVMLETAYDLPPIGIENALAVGVRNGPLT